MKRNTRQRPGNGVASPEHGEQGFMLLGLIVVIAIILIGLGVAASEVAFSLRREREVESARRADQYVRAIRRFYLKNQHYPGSIEQLENTNNIRYLRQKYVDPLTGKADYRLIPVGQNKTTVKGFFGQPLAGLATTGLGSVAGMQSTGIPGPGGTANAAPGAGGPPGLTDGSGNTSATAPAGATGTGGIAGQTNTSPTSSPFGSGSGLPGGAVGPFMGVGSSASGKSILVVNEQTTYETWEFLYDPRIEKLKQAAALNAGASSVGAGAIGGSTNPSGLPSSTNPGGLPGGTNLPGGGGPQQPGPNPTQP
jgi:type II secretory pathway pseudopilin PulG